MDEHKDAAQRIEEIAGLCDELRLKKHLLGLEGRDLLEKLERKLAHAEHRLRGAGTPQNEIARLLHGVHQAVKRLRGACRAAQRPVIVSDIEVLPE